MYIYDIPYRIFRQIVNSLDTDKGWELLASEIGYTFDQIRQLEMVLMQPQGSPTRNLLWDWGCQNATVWDLYDKLKKMKRFREMNFLEKLVNGEADNTNHSNRVDMMEDLKKSTMLSPVDNPGKLPQPGSAYNLNCNLNQATIMNVTGKLTDSNNRKINLGSTPSKNSLSDKPNKDLRKTPMESTLPITKRQPKVSISDTHNCVQITSPFSENADSITSTLPIRSLEGCPVFTYKELSCATDGFNDDHKIGEGAFGNVYMGTLRNSECAIKKLVKKAGDGSGSEHITQQRAELVALLKFRHEHIVTLYGYALDGDEICLIYQYMVGGSLEDRLQCKSGTRALNWAQRVNIATGAACGLQYLHTADSRPLIHSDIKSANILLDKHFEAKIGDFGLARYATSGSHTGILTHVSKKNMAGKIYGTKAYLPPEFFRSNGQVSIKGDTYGFGVIILEICTGEKAFDENREPKKFLHEYMQDNLELRKPSDWPLLRDTKAGPVSEKLIIQLMELAQKCISSKKKDRPDMTEVLKELKQLEDDWFNNKLAAEPTTNMLPVDSFEQAQHYESHLSHGSKSPHPLAIPNICENSLKQQQNFLDAPSKQVDPTSPVGQILKTTPAAELPEAARLQLLYDHQDLSGGTTDTEFVDKMKKLQICKELLSSDDKLAKIQKFDETFNSYREPAKLPVITMGPGSCSSADNTVIPGLVSQQQESLEENFALDSFDTEHTSDQPPAGVSKCNSILKKKKMDDFFKDYSQKALGVNSVEEENRRIRLLAECQYLKTDDGVVNLSDNE